MPGPDCSGRVIALAMILTVDNLLSGERLTHLKGLLDDVEFIDGRKTAGWHAQLVKANEQSDGRNPKTQKARKLVQEAVQANATVVLAVMPSHVRPILFSRYREGMSYGAHIDDAIMGRGQLARSDVSMTLFLNAPEDYDGGELVMAMGGSEFTLKVSTTESRKEGSLKKGTGRFVQEVERIRKPL